MVDFSKILDALEHGIQFAEKAVPAIAELTPYGALATTVVQGIGAVTDIVQNVQQRVSDGTIVLNSTDATKVRDMAQRLHGLNEQLSQQVDDS